MTPRVDVTFCFATASARAAGVGAFYAGSSASSDAPSSMRSIFLSSESQSLPLMTRSLS